ncbi:MAG: radical SAM family heme chaperone HemW [Clostridiales bacterium]|nr:radical SAM family heme chaperone HemW [Clostridiales bacterium]
MMTTSDEKAPYGAAPATGALGLYIHIPFCVRKCRYCDYTSCEVGDKDVHFAYALKVIYELRAKRAALAGVQAPRFGALDCEAPVVDTVYIGGGTPSFIEAGFVTEILDAVYTTYRVTDDAEVTIEVNPGTVDEEKFRRYASSGINRISVGAQSFSVGSLAFLGRIHQAEDTVKCVLDARAVGIENISLDLIYGVPGQGRDGWEKDLAAAASLSPSHISIYDLTIEEGTPLHADYMRGGFEAVSEEDDRLMYHIAKGYLAEQGFRLYELSNSARPGKESRHNMKYWSMEPYAGFGLGAHSYFGGLRLSNTSELDAYLTAESESDMTDWVHENTLSDDMSEFVFLGLRRTSGIELSRFNSCFGRDFWELYGEETNRLIGRGLLEKSGDALRLTSLGLDLANSVFREYVLE